MQEPYLDVNGRPLLISVRILQSTTSDGLVLVAGDVMRVQLKIALKLIKLGICERKNPKRSSSKRRRALAEKKARLESQELAANPTIIIEEVE